ncbi:MAG: hypothetical protein HY788_16020 [Deltaproteobacteria bacterium]|nr:hypothetical protein [Deltaproteobacteria bacterium]
MFHRNRFLNMALSVVALFLFSVGPAPADEVTEAIEEGLKQYNDGKYTEATGSLDYASQLIRQKKSQDLLKLLPEPLSGWTAEEGSSEAVGGAMFGGAVTAKRTYSKDSSSVSVEFMADSPMLQGMMMMFTNPVFATSDGGKLEKISGQRAIVKYDASDKTGEIKIIVANRFLVTVSGDGIAKKELTDYAQAIQYDKLAVMP